MVPIPDPSLISDLDQLGAILKAQARVAGEYFKALIANGFDRYEALELVREWNVQFFSDE